MQDLRFEHAAILARQLAEDLAERMRSRLQKQAKVALAVSGGKTPIAFFQQLSQQALDWQRVLITLVDERWVAADSDSSNERLVRQYLLQNKAKNAWLVPLKTAEDNVQDGFFSCETRLQEQLTTLDYAVMGMGNDGHTASWFPHSVALDKVFNPHSNAKCCPVLDAPEYPRMTLTWQALAQCRHLFLHFQGEEKNQVFQQAKQAEQPEDIRAMPVRHLLTQQQVPISIYRTL